MKGSAHPSVVRMPFTLLPWNRKKCFTFTGLYYINTYGHEIHPVPTREYISGLDSNEVLVYSCGSLWTRSVFNPNVSSTQLKRQLPASFLASRCVGWLQPSQVLDLFVQRFFFVGLHPTVPCNRRLPGQLSVNSKNDRETEGYTAVHYIQSVWPLLPVTLSNSAD
jgi:hypothetical protein